MKVQEMVLNSTPLFVCLKLNVIIFKLADKFPLYYLCQESIIMVSDDLCVHMFILCYYQSCTSFTTIINHH